MKNNYLYNIIQEILFEEYVYLIEGVDIDVVNKTVSFNDNHEENVDTSIILNPTISKIGDIDIISIFKRKVSSDFNSDGNPLVYALKGVNGWKFNNPKSDITNLLKKFIRIVEKIEDKYDTIITIPSNNQLNHLFLNRLNKIIKSDFQITDYLHKMNVNDVYENYIDWKALKTRYNETFNNKKELLNSYFKKMEEDNDGYFSFKYIKDIKLREYITNSIYSDKDSSVQYSDKINGKNILILDDTIGSGKTISESCKEILDSFEPSKITVITLFSKL